MVWGIALLKRGETRPESLFVVRMRGRARISRLSASLVLERINMEIIDEAGSCV